MNTTSPSVPDLSSAYNVPSNKVAQFRRDGHILLRGICSRAELDVYRPLIAEEVERRKHEARGGVYQKSLRDRNTRDKAFLQLENLWADNKKISQFCLARRFGQIAADLLGVDAVRMYHDQALFKEPGGGYTPWHQDQFYWPLDTTNTVTMWMPLVDTGAEMGTLIYASGMHQRGPMVNLAISDYSEDAFKNIVKNEDTTLVIGELNAGDATWHYGWTPHKAPGNATDTMRQIMTIIYFADGARVIEPTNEKQPGDLARWLPGLRPGDLAASPINPVVFQRD
jgi:ectoine hydroxylase-related dioxygenase (phytanoyl-CoA dioxygenase family)